MQKCSGFTLIELAVVLVIIGLLAGGILVGRDLINAGDVRSQISQIEKYQRAVNTFKVKYQSLPGDLDAATASQFGFVARGQYAGQGDGNGVIEGVQANSAGQNYGYCMTQGETVTFWVDLSYAKLIEGEYTLGAPDSIAYPGQNFWPSSATYIHTYLPRAKINETAYVYAWSGGWNAGSMSLRDGKNYFGVSTLTRITWSNGAMYSSPAITVYQANSIDSKMDDGLPMSGKVLALASDAGPGGISWSGGVGGAPFTTATAGSSTTCFDNGNTGGATQQYSVGQGGSSRNCSLSFMFQ